MIEEKVQVIADEKFPLEALLTLPDNLENPAPAVVMVHGSGPNNKDEQIMKTALFKDLAKDLAAAGIASLRYDKRTLVYGKEMVTDKAITVKEETIDDGLAATRLLRQDSRINAKQIFIIGHSMGAMLAPRIDAEGGNFAGMILMAGSPRRLEDIIIEQNETAVSQMDEATQQAAAPQIAAMKAAFARIYEMTDEEAQNTDLGIHIPAYYLKEWGEKPAAQYLSNLTKPILILQGEKDFQVSIKNDFEKYQEILEGKSIAEFHLYPNLSHVFMASQGKSIKDGLAEYDADIHLDSSVVEDIVKFIKTN